MKNVHNFETRSSRTLRFLKYHCLQLEVALLLLQRLLYGIPCVLNRKLHLLYIILNPNIYQVNYNCRIQWTTLTFKIYIIVNILLVLVKFGHIYVILLFIYSP